MIGDGKCVIDIVHRINGPSFDYATFDDIRIAATKIFQTCVDGIGHSKRGGFIGKVGQC